MADKGDVAARRDHEVSGRADRAAKDLRSQDTPRPITERAGRIRHRRAGRGSRRDIRRVKSQRPIEAHQETTTPTKPAWQVLLDPQERPNREDIGSQHNVFTDSMLEPVPLPRWLRGKRRPPIDKIS
jgi:hypothetical protein